MTKDKTTVTVGFGYRVPQDLPGYPSGPGGMFLFTFEVNGAVTTRQSALVAAAFFREEFLKRTKEAGISSRLQVLSPRDGSRAPWIPTCYLDKCEYVEVNGQQLLS